MREADRIDDQRAIRDIIAAMAGVWNRIQVSRH
jgi:hypothetical protein